MDDDPRDIVQRCVEAALRRVALTQRAVDDVSQIAARTAGIVERSRALLARLNGNNEQPDDDA